MTGWCVRCSRLEICLLALWPVGINSIFHFSHHLSGASFFYDRTDPGNRFIAVAANCWGVLMPNDVKGLLIWTWNPNRQHRPQRLFKCYSGKKVWVCAGRTIGQEWSHFRSSRKSAGWKTKVPKPAGWHVTQLKFYVCEIYSFLCPSHLVSAAVRQTLSALVDFLSVAVWESLLLNWSDRRGKWLQDPPRFGTAFPA